MKEKLLEIFRELEVVLLKDTHFVTFRGAKITRTNLARLITLRRDCPQEFRKMFFTNRTNAGQYLVSLTKEGNIAVAPIESAKVNKLDRNYLEGFGVCPVIDSLTGQIYFFSIVLNKVVPMSEKVFRKSFDLTKENFETALTSIELTHDITLPEGSTGDKINCTTFAPWVF